MKEILLSLASAIRNIRRLGFLLALLAPALILDVSAQDKPRDLSGLWFLKGIPWIRIFQDGAKIKAVYVTVDPPIQEKYGFRPGDTQFFGLIEGRTVRGKLNAHYPVKPFKANCPDVWAYWADLELAISTDGNTLEGRWKWFERNEADCKIVQERWEPLIPYTRPPAPEVTHEGGGIRISLPEALLFDFDKYDLKPEAQAVLAQAQSTIAGQQAGANLVVEGHTDDRGSLDYNNVLSQRRAESVATWLKEHGVTASRLAVKGYGKSKPKYPNDTEENRHRNRRVEILVLPPSK